MGASQGEAPQPTIGELVDDAMTAIERDNAVSEGRVTEGLRAAWARQVAPRPAHRPGQRHRARQTRGPRQGHARSRLRVLFVAVRQRRRQEGRPILHTVARCARAGRDARTRTRAVSTTRAAVRRNVRAVGESSSHARRRQARRHQHLRPGIELHDLASRTHEPRHPRHRRPDRPRRYFSQRSPARPQSRLHPRQSAI